MPTVLEATQTAAEQLAWLTGRQFDSVSAVKPNGDGWRFEVELVELDRIPQTTSVLGTYEVETDRRGNVASYRRLRRYTRSQAGGHD